MLLYGSLFCPESTAMQIQRWLPTVCSSSKIFDEGLFCSSPNTEYNSMFAALFWRFSPVWGTIWITQKGGIFCPFMVIDPANLGVTIVVAH